MLGGGSPQVSDSALRRWRAGTAYWDECPGAAQKQAGRGSEGGDSEGGGSKGGGSEGGGSEGGGSEGGGSEGGGSEGGGGDGGMGGGQGPEAVAAFGPAHATARGVWECLARASGPERAAVWRFATGKKAPPRAPWPRPGAGDEHRPFSFLLQPPRALKVGAGSPSAASPPPVPEAAAHPRRLFTAATCFGQLACPFEPWEGGLPHLAACLAESVAASVAAGLAQHHAPSPLSGGGPEQSFDAAQLRLGAAVQGAAARVAGAAAAASSSSSSSSAGGEGGSAVDTHALRSLFPNAYMCPRCGCGPIDHRACADLKSHHGERVSAKGTAKGTAKGRVSNACPQCGWFSRDLADWEPWNGSFQ